MAAGIFNIAKGKIARYAELPETSDAFIFVLLQASVADGTLEDFDNLSLLLADAGNTEATFTGYSRVNKTDITLTTDDTANQNEVNAPTDPQWSPTTAQSLVKILICYDNDTGTGDDTNIVPLMHDDFVTTTATSGTLTYNVAADFMTAS